MSVLLADIGGTHARFAILKSGKISDIYRYRCSDFKSAYMAIRSFLLMQIEMPENAVIAMAGVIINGKGKWTNLPWTLDEKKFKKQFGFRSVLLVNDLIPQGEGISCLKSTDVIRLNKVKPQKQLLKVLMSLGTGVGACIISKDIVYPTEYGQTVLPNRQTLEKSLLGHDNFYYDLALAAQNLALLTQPMGGLYITGGMLSATNLKKEGVIKQFTNHPTMQALLKKVPVYLVVNRDLAFLGLSKLAKKSCLT